jgi:threonylcarbamoyladenosine tRNA methylthiotransferase MtaB
MKYAVLTFGCRVNQADSCAFEDELQAQGATPGAVESADVVVVNTCTVTAAADQSARRAIRRIARLNPRAAIVATGCAATRTPAATSALASHVRLVPNDRKADLGRIIEELGHRVRGDASPAVPGEPLGEVGTTNRRPTASRAALFVRPGSRGRTAYPLRVQTGCDEHCSYCIVPSTRGRSISDPASTVLAAIERAADAGFAEIWLTGVHLGSYGRDLNPPASLTDLAMAIARLERDVHIRLGSIEPMDVPDGLLDVVANATRFRPHLHVPLQHASSRLLEAMKRPYTLAHYRQLVDHVHARMPDASLGTDVIVGFPGETDGEVDELVAYLERSALSYVHVFPYSDRPGTEASRMAGQIDAGAIRDRARRVRDVADRLRQRFAESQVGRVREALTIEDGSRARTDNNLDVAIPTGRLRNCRVRVVITSAEPLRAEVVE